MKVAVLGFGTVGQGVYGMLAHSKGLEQGPVLVRPGKDNEPWKVADMNAIVSDASVGAVAEVMGGVEARVQLLRYGTPRPASMSLPRTRRSSRPGHRASRDREGARRGIFVQCSLRRRCAFPA